MTSAQQLLDPPHIRDAAAGQKLTSALDLLGGFLAEKGLTEVFRARTLHMHFPVGADEALLETFDGNAQAITTDVVPASEVDECQASQWGFFADGTKVALGYSTDEVCTPTIAAQVAMIGTFLSEHELTRIIAVELRDDSLQAGPNQVILELTDEGARSQRTTVAPLEIIGDERPAGWSFTPEGKAMPGTWCSTHNRSHG